MKRDGLLQVAILFVLTLLILFALSLIPPIKLGSFETRRIDLLSDLRNNDDDEETFYDDPHFYDIPADSTGQNTDSLPPQDTPAAATLPTDSPAIRTLPPAAKGISPVGDIIPIEDYTASGMGIQPLRSALDSAASRTVRILFLGDSFIEADILTQHIRRLLQQRYGGKGVGYMAMHSDFPGFRRSIRQTDGGWESHTIVNGADLQRLSLPLQYYVPQSGAYTRFKGTAKYVKADSWDISRVVFVADSASHITLETDSSRREYTVEASARPRMITMPCHTTSLTVRCDSTAALQVWGTWLDGCNGVAVDNISMRGYSGSSLSQLPADNITALQDLIHYDMVVLQYGLNRMSAGDTGYEAFADEMVQIVEHLRQAMPQAAFLIMGIGDRCANRDGEMKTMREVYLMRKAQRTAAREAKCLFWDTCEAMKQDGGMVQYVENKHANKDYTHISHAGGKPLAKQFVRALGYALGDSVLTDLSRQ